MTLKRIFITSICSLMLASASSAQETQTQSSSQSAAINYIPEIHGVVRARWLIDTDGGLNRFQVRNARLSAGGRVAKPVDYYLQVDFCNSGKIQFLDAWARVAIIPELKIKAGQYRIPFGVDPFRGPANYIFANRSFIGRDIDNIRAVGVMAEYDFSQFPLTLQGGIFNPTVITDQSTSTHEKVWAAKAIVKLGDFSLSGSFQSIIPDSIRINMADAAITYRKDRWTAEAEYMYQHYTHDTYKPCHAYNAYVNYAMPVKLGIFNTLSFQGRFDGSTSHSNGKRNADGHLTETNPNRKRITVGSMLTYNFKRLRCDFRVNYEKFFYDKGQVVPDERGDRFTAELVVAF